MKRLFYLAFVALAVFACDKPQVEPKPTPGPDDDQKEQTDKGQGSTGDDQIYRAGRRIRILYDIS